MKDEASPSNLKIDVLTKGVKNFMDMIESIERKPQCDNQKAPLVRNPNFRMNQNQNTRKNGLDQNIRPPLQEIYAETSHLEDPKQDT